MKLDYSKIDAELLPGLELMPPGLGSLTRESLGAVRDMRAAQPAERFTVPHLINGAVVEVAWR